MKGKSTFTTREIREIKQLIAQKNRITTDKQKPIRQKIRNLGFYYSDFSSRKVDYTVEDFDNLVRSGQIKIIDDARTLPSEVTSVAPPTTSSPLSMSLFTKDEAYVLELCDRALGRRSERQHKFEFLLGDANTRGSRARLPVDAFYVDLNLVVEYRERQHTEAVRFFDKPNQLTVSGVHRGEQRKRYDEYRRHTLPEHGIAVIEISYSDFSYDRQKRIVREPGSDQAVVTQKLKDFIQT